jgi:hypothetical protein
MFHSKAALELISTQLSIQSPVETLVESDIDLAVERFFKYGYVKTEGVYISAEKVLAEIGSPLIEVNKLLMMGEANDAIQLNNELLTQSVKSLIIEALASAKAA